jgi:hypothetical protein
MPHRNPDHVADIPLSAMLREVGAQGDGHVSIGDITERFGPRAFGAVLFIFGLINLFPWPPGGTTITGAPLLLIAAQMAIGVHTVWLPRTVTKRGLDAAVFRKGLARVLPWLERLEKVSRPRLGFLFGPVGDRVLGLVCTLLALIIVLPIFGGNFLPAVAVSVLAISLVLRDGVLALLGYALVASTGALLFLVAGMIIEGFQGALEWGRGLLA